jgi:hypothetical protein
MSSLFPQGLFPELDIYIKDIIYNEVRKLTSNLPPPDIEARLSHASCHLGLPQLSTLRRGFGNLQH